MIENGGPATFINNTYKALRLISPDFNLYYSVWCSGEHELYDLTVCHPNHPFLSVDYTDSEMYRPTPTNCTTSTRT